LIQIQTLTDDFQPLARPLHGLSKALSDIFDQSSRSA
jgi:hypothetical protein